ncbi:MAG: hypothetical protein JJU02_12365 [Cryomorphaceae bacterium]|nr:hypothetical protein [Cryomorphaceae bacterium]
MNFKSTFNSVYVWSTFVLTGVLFLPLYGQYEYVPLSWEYRMINEAALLDTGVAFHHSVRNYRRSEIGNVNQTRFIYGDSVSLRFENKVLRWFEGAVFNNNFIRLKGKDYEVNINPILNLEIGNPTSPGVGVNYLNTRGVWIEGAVGKHVTFYSMLSENMGRFPLNYYNHYRSTQRVMGWGVLNYDMGDSVLDFPMAMGAVTYTPNHLFSFTFGNDKQFLGEGYRSMLLSDWAMNYPYFKIETTFGNVKYLNLYAVQTDPRPSMRQGGLNRYKYTSIHYLSWNVNRRLNFSAFESMVWGGDTTLHNSGFDIHMLNPVIMYRPVEKGLGAAAGNAMIGVSSSYLLFRGLRLYGQFALDDFQLAAARQYSDGHWLNFYSWQMGARYADAFGIEGLFLLVEHNAARPFMYAHRTVETNYSHQNYPLAHPWGSSFKEFVFKGTYQRKRLVLDAMVSYGYGGRDTAGLNLGNDIFRSYGEGREETLGYFIGGGNRYHFMFTEAKLGYVMNIQTGARVEAGIRLRNLVFKNDDIPQDNFAWYFLGVRTPLFNRYFDHP